MTYGHLSGEGLLMKLKDILKPKQLSLTFFVVLDSFEIPTQIPRSRWGMKLRVKLLTLFGYWHRIRYASAAACILVERTSALRWSLRPVAETPQHHEIDQFERLGRSLVGHERDLWTLALCPIFGIPGGGTLTPVWIYPGRELR